MPRPILKPFNSPSTISTWVLLAVLVSSITTSCRAVYLSQSNSNTTILFDNVMGNSTFKNQEERENISLSLDFLEEFLSKTNKHQHEPEIGPTIQNLRSKRIVRSADSTTTSSPELNNSGSSWSKLQISPHELGSMPYDHYGVSIYGHSKNGHFPNITNKQFFYAPISQLDPTSAKALSNKATGKAELKFLINMWNTDVEEEVRKYTEELVGHPVKHNRIRVLPLEKVRLSSRIPSTTYQLSNTWVDYHRHRYLSFTLTCQSLSKCEELEYEMRSSPENFDHFRLQFSMASQTSERQDTTIRIENIVEGQLVSNLIQRYPEAKEVLLTAKDEKRLLAESTFNIIIESFDDSVILNPNSEKNINDILKDLLITSRVTISNQSSHMWESVFWNDDNYRPDKSSRVWNEIYNKSDKETQKKLTAAFNYEKKSETTANLGFTEWKAGYESSDQSSISSSVDYDDISKLFQESKDTVQWDGEKFIPKPMSLSKFNLAALRDKQSFKNRNVRVSYTTAMLSISVNIPLVLGGGESSLLFELKKDMKEISSRQSTYFKELEEKQSRFDLKIQNDVLNFKKEIKESLVLLENKISESIHNTDSILYLQGFGSCRFNHTGQPGSFNNPNYPLKYTQQYQKAIGCRYYMDVGFSRVLLTFATFEINDRCHFKVYDDWEGENLLLVAKSNQFPAPVTSSGRKMMVDVSADKDSYYYDKRCIMRFKGLYSRFG